MTQNCKILISGPVGAGKTSAIAALSDVPVVRTERAASDEVKALKENTTVAMDYGLIRLADGTAVHLYGTPGQDRFNFMWTILAQGGLGLVLLVNNAAPDPLGDLRFFLRAFADFIQRTALVIGVTHMDQGGPTLDDFASELEAFKFKAPVFEVDARERRDVHLLLRALLYTLDPGVHS